MDLPEAMEFLEEALELGLNATLSVTQPNPELDQEGAQISLHLSVSPNVAPERRRLPLELVRKALDRGLLPGSGDLLLGSAPTPPGPGGAPRRR